MNATTQLRAEMPFVVTLCATPLLCEAVIGALRGFADVRPFPAGARDVAGLLRSLAPDAVVVDRQEEAERAAAWAEETRTPLVHIALAERKLRLLVDGAWADQPEMATTATENLRNTIVGAMYSRRREH